MDWNKVYYMDCMDKKEGIPSIKDKIFDLCLTDPPSNKNYDGSLQSDMRKTRAKKECYKDIEFFDDYREDYVEWIEKWFKEIMRISKRLIMTLGRDNLIMWLRIKEPEEILVHYKKNCVSQRSMVRFTRWEPILVYGKWKHQFDFTEDVFDVPLKSGFLRDTKYVHPCPKPEKLWLELIKQVKPENIIDPFIGSGVTAEVCEMYSIPWIGYEINDVYKEDINLRILRGKKNKVKKQEELKI